MMLCLYNSYIEADTSHVIREVRTMMLCLYNSYIESDVCYVMRQLN